MENWQELVSVLVQAGAVGFLAPIVIGWLNQNLKTTWVREFAALGISAIFGGLIVIANGISDTMTMVAVMGAIMTEAQVFYGKYWKPLWAKK